jgi:hypothetical protein
VNGYHDHDRYRDRDRDRDRDRYSDNPAHHDDRSRFRARL